MEKLRSDTYLTSIISSIILFISLGFATISCNPANNTTGDSLVFKSDDWKKDQLGCDYIRFKMYQNVINRKNEFIKIDKEEVIAIFGTPNYTRKWEDQNLYFYFIEPGEQCMKGSMKYDNIESAKVIFVIDSLNKVQEINTAFP